MSGQRHSRPLTRVALLLALLLTSALALSGCASSLSSGPTRLAPQQKQALGDKLHPQLVEQFGGRYENARVSALVSQVGARLAASLASDPASAGAPTRWTFTVLDTATPNAFALPGGYVYVTRGLMPFLPSEDALAAAIAHEIGHVTEDHYAERLDAARRGLNQAISAGRAAAFAGASRAAQTDAAAAAWIGYIASFSREQELEADLSSVRTLARAGYNPYAQASLIGSLQAIDALEASQIGDEYSPDAVDWYSLHPSSAERLRLTQAGAAAVSPTGPVADRTDTLLDAVDGMLFGESPEEGYLRGDVFLDPIRGVAFSAPGGYRLTRTPEAVVALGPDGAALTYFGGEDVHSGAMTTLFEEISDEAVRDGDAPLTEIQGFTVNGLDAASAKAGEVAKLPGAEALIVAIRVSGRVHFFVAFYPKSRAQLVSGSIRAAIESFRLLSPAERAALKPRWIEVVRVRSGETAGSLARRMPAEFQRGGLGEALFRALNGLAPDDRLRPGQRVKLIREG